MGMRDVVIVGAGLAGSSLATVLSGLGWDVLLLERRHLPQHKVCGEFLSPESQASLWALGLYDTVAALHPVPMGRARLITPQGRSMEVALPGPAWGVSRFALDLALANAASRAGAEVQMGVTVTEVTPGEQGYSIAWRSEQQQTTVQAQSVIVACGRHPVAALRPRSEQTVIEQTHVGVKCHYRNIRMPSQVELYLFSGGYVGLAPVEDGQVNLCLLATRDAFTRAGASIDGLLAAIVRWNPALQQRLAGGQIVPETKLAVAPVDTERPATPWEGLARVGDAVTMIPPLCGDGMAMALRSAELCAPLAHDFLRGRLSLAAWETDYRRAWHAEFDQPLRTGRRLQPLLTMAGVADGLLMLGNLLPFLSTYLVKATRGRARDLHTVARLVPAMSGLLYE